MALKGSAHGMWRGGRCVTKHGYVLRHVPDHPSRPVSHYVREHVLIAEQVLGRPLPPRAVVHHINGNTADNRLENLVICENQGYHILLHTRLRALTACGDPTFRRCNYCRQWDNPANLATTTQRRAHHPKCKSAALLADRRARQARYVGCVCGWRTRRTPKPNDGFGTCRECGGSVGIFWTRRALASRQTEGREG